MDLSYALDYPVVSGTSPQRVHVLLRIETWPEEGGAARKPMDLAVVLDRSESMSGEKLAGAKEAVLALVERLGPEDLFTLVAFDAAVEVVIPPGRVADREEVRRRVAALRVGSTTNLSGGWLRALGLMAENPAGGRLRRVLLLTDGQANVGVTDKMGLVEIGRSYRELGIVTTTLGFGRDFNEDHLSAMATASGGHFHFIGSPEQAAAAFLEEFGEAARVFGQNCEVAILPAAGVGGPEILQPLPSRREGRTVAVELGDVRDRDLKTLLVAFDLPGGLAPGPMELAAVKVRYDAVRGKVGLRQHALGVGLSVEPGREPGTPAREVRREVVWQQAMRGKGEAWRRLDAGDPEGCRLQLRWAADLLKGERALDPEAFDREVANLRALVSGEHGLLGKELAAQAHAAGGQRGLYQQAPATFSRGFRFTPREAETLDEISEVLKEKLREMGYKEPAASGLDLALRELVENALEHGCRGRPDGRVEVDLGVSRNYARVTVRDDGPGFDFAATLAREEAEGAADAGRTRGRGLLLARRAVGSLTANAAGNEVTASVRRLQARFEASTESVIDERGVGNIAILKVSASLDAHSVMEFRAQLDRVLQGGAVGVIIDLSRCEYINSESVGELVNIRERLGDPESRVVLVSPSGNVRTVLDLLGLKDFFAIAPTVEEARRLLTG